MLSTSFMPSPSLPLLNMYYGRKCVPGSSHASSVLGVKGVTWKDQVCPPDQLGSVTGSQFSWAQPATPIVSLPSLPPLSHPKHTHTHTRSHTCIIRVWWKGTPTEWGSDFEYVTGLTHSSRSIHWVPLRCSSNQPNRAGPWQSSCSSACFRRGSDRRGPGSEQPTEEVKEERGTELHSHQTFTRFQSPSC